MAGPLITRHNITWGLRVQVTQSSYGKKTLIYEKCENSEIIPKSLENKS